MTFLPGLGEKIALSLTLDLVKASAAVVRRRLGKSDADKALQAAIAQALDEALESIEVPVDLSDHYAGLLEDFFHREEIVAELAQLLDPRPDVELDFAAVTKQFETEHDRARLEHLDLAAFMRAFASAFYSAAASQETLKGNLEMKLLGEMVKRTGMTVQATERTAAATEVMTGLLQQYLEDQNGKDALFRAVLEAQGQGMLAAFQAFEGIAAGMFKAGFDFGVGRTGLIEIGGDLKALPPAQAETIRTLAGDLRRTVLDATPGPAELDALEQRYRQHIIRWFESLQFQGLMRTPRPIVLPLEDVYVELRAVAEVPDAADAFSAEERRLLLEDEQNPDGRRDRRELMSQLDALRRERWSRTLPERKSIAESLHQRDRRAFVILGDPGSGKTTLLHFLALVYARGSQSAAERLKIDSSEADRLPIFVPLAAFDDMLRESRRAGGSLTLLEFLPRYYDRRRGLPGLEPLFRRALTSGHAVVLFDGLDEVIDVGTRTYVAEQAGALINEWSPRGVRFAVSSRFVGYREAPVPGNLPTLSVLDFGLPEIEIFVHRWAEAYEKWAANGESPEMFHRARRLESELLTDVKSNESVRRLAANPLMITMLALLRRQVGRLPHRRVQLYESYVCALLENWMDARSQGAREQSVEILDRHQAENLLIPLALWLQKEKPSGTASRAEIQQKLTDICLEESGMTGKATRPQIREAEGKALRFLQEMRQMTGLLVERGHDVFGFLHLTFQEYFAGRALARLSDEERRDTVHPNRHDPRWREPILLCAGRLGIVENRRPQVTEFVRGILDYPDDTEEKLHRNLLLALDIGGDDVNLEPGLVSEIVGRAVACLPTWIETLAKSLVGGLGQLIANGAVGAGACFGEVWMSENWWLRRITVEALGRFAGVPEIRQVLLEQLDGEDFGVSGAAIDALSTQLESCVEVRRAVLKKLDDNFLCERAVRCLVNSSWGQSDVCAAVLAKLNDPDPHIRVATVGSLMELVGSEEIIQLALMAKLDDSDSNVRCIAVNALTLQVESNDAIARAVAAKLEDSDSDVREAAANAMSVLGRISEELSQSFEIWVDDREDREKTISADWTVRKKLAENLTGSAELPALEYVAQILENRDTLESMAALSEMVSAAPVWLTEKETWRIYWLDKLISEHPGERAAALSGLSVLGLDEIQVREVALKALDDKCSCCRASAVGRLTQFVRTDGKAREMVLGLLSDESSCVQKVAVRALAGLVLTDTGVRQAILERVAVAQDYGVRDSLFSALSSLVGSEPAVRSAFLAETDNPYIGDAAFGVLARLVKEDVGVRHLMLARLGAESVYVRANAVCVLSELMETIESIRYLVVKCSESNDYVMRQAALAALSRVVEKDLEARRLILGRIEDERYEVRQEAVRALASLAVTWPDITEKIADRLTDKQFTVRLAAVRALSSGLPEPMHRSILSQMRPWLALDIGENFEVQPPEAHEVRIRLASLFGRQIPADSDLRAWLLDQLRSPRWSVRQGAVLTFLAWPGAPPDEIREEVFQAYSDRRGLEAYPAQLTAASFLVNRAKYTKASVELSLEALDYGTRPWEYLPMSSMDVRKQAALVLGKLEPIAYDERVFSKLLHVLENDEDENVRDSAFGALVRLARVREQVVATAA